MNKSTKDIIQIAMIAGVYTVVSLVFAPLSFGPIQVRFAECLALLPLIYKKSIGGVILGCFVTNLVGVMMGVNILGFADVIIGTFATGLAAVMTYHYRNHKIKNIPVISILAPVVVNGVIIGLELAYAFMPNDLVVGAIINGLQVALGELIAVVFGYFLVQQFDRIQLFKE